jgi:adenylate cyclase
VERRLAAILVADVVGFSTMMERAEEATYASLKRLRLEVIEPGLARHHGRLIKSTGDGILAAFASAVAAARCAIEIQQHLSSSPGGMRLRIGLNLGDVIIQEDGDIYGEGINIAARLEALADPGGILVSAKIHDEIDGKLEGAFEDRGERQLKNVSRPIRTYAWVANRAGGPMARVNEADLAVAEPAPPDKPSIAVLPFRNMSDEPEQEYFADGMVEDIITALSHFKSLFVVARNSSFVYKGKAVDIKQIGRALGVRYVLEGGVRKAGRRVRITAQLIEAGTGRHVWADKVDGALEDVFDLQDQVTTSVVGLLAPTLEQTEIERSKQKPTGKLDSYDYYLRGMALINERSARHHQSLTEGRAFFIKAFERDPQYAAAYAQAAWTFLREQGVAGLPLADRARREAIELANRAAGLAEDDALVLARSAHVLAYFAHEYGRATTMVEQAVTLNPNLAVAWFSRGWISLMCGDAERAVESFARMLRLSPLDPLTAVAWTGSAFALFHLGRYDDGCALAAKSTQFLNDAHTLCAWIVNAVGAGRLDEAQRTTARLLKLEPDFRSSHVHDTFPVRLPEERERLIAALRKAGVPA